MWKPEFTNANKILPVLLLCLLYRINHRKCNHTKSILSVVVTEGSWIPALNTLAGVVQPPAMIMKIIVELITFIIKNRFVSITWSVEVPLLSRQHHFKSQNYKWTITHTRAHTSDLLVTGFFPLLQIPNFGAEDRLSGDNVKGAICGSTGKGQVNYFLKSEDDSCASEKQNLVFLCVTDLCLSWMDSARL